MLALVPVLASAQATAPSSERLDFVSGLTEFRKIREMLPSYLNRRAGQFLRDRQRAVAALSTPTDVASRKSYIRERMHRSLGGLPERTPLNSRIAGVLDRSDYKIEKIIFESQPGFYVTANLYLPKNGRPPFPGVLFPLGHETGAKANLVWQQALSSLARKGFVALAWDPLGQGERVQLFDPDLGASKFVRSVSEHSMLAVQCLIVGDNLARYIVWDGIRALDYLLSRSEVDPARIGCTGNSGGGTQTAYLAALDDRIRVAAPSCWLTSWGRLLESVGPQDGEQNLVPWLSDGLDHADFIHAFAPRPHLALAGIRDYFPISGTRESFEEARRIYGLLGAEDKVRLFEADDEHGYGKPRRLAAYGWLSRWLKGVEDDGREEEFEPATEEELRCTASGQVSTSLGGETVFTLNRKRSELFAGKRTALRREEFRKTIARMTGFERKPGSVPVSAYGRIARSGYGIEKLVYESEPGIRVPALLFLPVGETKRSAVIYVHGRGKSAGAGPGDGDIEALLKGGLAVLAIDARGWGETRVLSHMHGPDFPELFGDYDSTMKAMLIGRTLVGMRALDVSRAVDLLSSRPEIDPGRICGVGKGAGAVPMAYAAVLDERIAKVVLDNMLISYDAATRSNMPRQVFENIVPGAVKVFDFPDLVAAMAPRQVWVLNAVDALGHRIGLSEMRNAYQRAAEAFRRSGIENAFQIRQTAREEGVQSIIRELR